MVVLRSMSLVHDAAEGFDAERERGDVEQQDVLDVAGEHAALDGRADGDDFVRVDAAVRLLFEESLTISPTAGMRVMPPTRMTSSMSLEGLRPASSRRGRHGFFGALRAGRRKLFELGARQRVVEVLGARRRPP
jgi:hypothetical protein